MQKTFSKEYEEDLSTVRLELEPSLLRQNNPTQKTQLYIPPHPFPAPDHEVSDLVNDVLDSIATLKKKKRYLDGFSVQVYTGRNRQDAFAMRSAFSMKIDEGELNNLTVFLEYSQPNFLLLVGHYFSKLEAQKDLVLIKKYFPKAILVPKKIPTYSEDHKEKK